MSEPRVDPDALLCALVLVPNSFSRNRFFGLFEKEEMRRVRRRASRIRGIIRQLAGTGRGRGEITGERVLDDGRVLLRFHMDDLAFTRTTSLSRLEAAVLRYALHKAGLGAVSGDDRDLVEGALHRLGNDLEIQVEQG